MSKSLRLLAPLLLWLACAPAPALAQRPVLQGKVDVSQYPDGSAQEVAKSPFLMQRLYLDIYHKLSILAGSLRRDARAIQRLEVDFAMWDQVKSSKVGRVYQDCIENYRAAYPHLIAAATLFEERAPVAQVNQESKVAQKFIAAGQRCNKITGDVFNTNTGGPPDSGPPQNYPPYTPPPYTPPTYNPPRRGDPSAPPSSYPGARSPGQSNPCQPYGRGGYDYCANPIGTRLPAGCVCPGWNNPASPLERKPQVLEALIPPSFSIFVPGIQNLADIVNFLSTYHPVETAYVGIGIAGGRLAAMPLPTTSVQVTRAVGGARYTGSAATVAARDANVSRVAPAVRALDRPIGRSPTQNQVVQDDIAALQKLGARDFRVNQQQVAANGERVGVNRPDLQFTHNGQRYHIEYDRPPPVRALGHGARLMANDQNSIIILKTVP